MFNFLVLLSLLLTSNGGYRVVAVILDASMLTQLGYNNQSESIYLVSSGISAIDPNTFKGYTQLKGVTLQGNGLTSVDLELFNDSSNVLLGLYFTSNPLTQLTNSKKITFPLLKYLNLVYCPTMTNLDSNVVNGTPSMEQFDYFDYNYLSQSSPIKPYQLSPWKKLEWLKLEVKNQSSLTKEHLNFLDVSHNNISVIGPGTFNGLKLIDLDLRGNRLTRLSNDTFLDQDQLQNIYLDGNMISSIELGTFNNLTSLKYITLSNNNITDLDSSTFAGCNNLESIYLANNPFHDSNSGNLQSICPNTAPNCMVY